MPTYEYACKECDDHLEVHQSFTDPPLTECPSCGGPLRKVFGNIAITFKGSGFYKTDSRDNGKKSAKSTDGDGGSSKTESPKTASSSSEPSSSGSSPSSSSTASSSSSSSSAPAAAAS